MRNYTFMRQSLAKPLSSPLVHRKITYVISMFVFMSSLFAGVFFSYCLPRDDRDFLVGPINDIFSSGHSSAIPSFITNITFLSIIFIAGLSLYGFVLSLVLLSSRSFAAGFCLGLFLWPAEAALPHASICSFVIVNILILLTMTCACSLSVNYAIMSLQNPAVKKQHQKDYIHLFMMLPVPLVIAAVIEGFILHVI